MDHFKNYAIEYRLKAQYSINLHKRTNLPQKSDLNPKLNGPNGHRMAHSKKSYVI